MKKVMISIALFASFAMIQSCASDGTDDDFYNNGPNGGITPGGTTGGGATGTTSIDTSVFSVAIDKTTAEPATSAQEYFPDDEDDLDNNTFKKNVSITFSDNAATWENDYDDVKISCNGAHVTIDNDTTKVNINLYGSTTAGSLTVVGSKKFKLTLNNVTITNPDSSAINLLNKKRAFVYLPDGSVNTLTDGSASKADDQKAAFYCKGKLLFNGTGSLSVYGNYKNGIQCADYIVFRAGNNVYVNSTANHGIKANDGIYINGGIINVEVSADAAKGINCEADIMVNGGRTTVVATGGCAYDSDDQEYKGAAGVKTDTNLTVNGGQLLATASGQGGKGVKADGTITVTGGVLTGCATGSNYGSSGNGNMPGGGGPGGRGGFYASSSSSNSKSAKGIKADGNISITDGTVNAYSANHEGLESKAAISVSGGQVFAVASDDAINSSSDMTISGGNVYAYSSGNDGLDANGNMYVQGGVAVAFGAGGAETGIDIDEQHRLYISGGELFGMGGRVDSSIGSSSQAYGYTTQSVSGSGYFVLSQGDTRLFAVKIPTSTYSGIVLASSASMSSGTSYTVGYASSVSGTEVLGFVASPTVSSVSSSQSFTARK